VLCSSLLLLLLLLLLRWLGPLVFPFAFFSFALLFSLTKLSLGDRKRRTNSTHGDGWWRDEDKSSAAKGATSYATPGVGRTRGNAEKGE
jgi:membrane protein required for beta-lactamase induction